MHIIHQYYYFKISIPRMKLMISFHLKMNTHTLEKWILVCCYYVQYPQRPTNNRYASLTISTISSNLLPWFPFVSSLTHVAGTSIADYLDAIHWLLHKRPWPAVIPWLTPKEIVACCYYLQNPQKTYQQ